MNVLLTSVGRRVALVRAFQKELCALTPSGRVFGTDTSSLSAAYRVVDRGILVPPCRTAEYIPALLDLVSREEIRVLVPLIDTELSVLADNRDRFSRLGCTVMVSSSELVRISRDKILTSEHFRALGFRTPQVLNDKEPANPEMLTYPLFLKPADGSGSVGTRKIADAQELRFYLERTQRPVVQGFVEGEEYTVDVFADLSGRVRCVVPRQRLETRAGEVSKGRTVRHQAVIRDTRRLVEALRECRGCVTLQCFVRPDGEVVFFEANLRFGGGFPLSYAAGANFPGWILRMCSGEPITDFEDWIDGLTMLRYDDAVFYREPKTT